MSDLRDTAASLGWGDVRTYIQSGNVVFDPGPVESSTAAEGRLARQLSSALSNRQHIDVPVIVRSSAAMSRIAQAHPDAGSDIPPKYLHVHLLDREPTSCDGVEHGAFAPDAWVLDGREVYVTYPNGSGRSKLTIHVFERAWGVAATGRNLTTIRRLADLAVGG